MIGPLPANLAALEGSKWMSPFFLCRDWSVEFYRYKGRYKVFNEFILRPDPTTNSGASCQ